jgi:hypothetical protein
VPGNSEHPNGFGRADFLQIIAQLSISTLEIRTEDQRLTVARGAGKFSRPVIANNLSRTG